MVAAEGARFSGLEGGWRVDDRRACVKMSEGKFHLPHVALLYPQHPYRMDSLWKPWKM